MYNSSSKRDRREEVKHTMGRRIGKVGDALKAELKDLKQEEKQARFDEALVDLMQVAGENDLVFALPNRASWGKGEKSE
jgi:hypothetical protein